jgi:SAM-dependent methyltransferase
MPSVQRYAGLATLARAYVNFSSPVAHAARRFIAEAARVATAPCAVTLDVGCGTCPYRTLIQAAFRSDSYIGLDVAPTDTTSVVADATCLPFADQTIDLVVSFDVIQHVAESDRMLDEAARVLRTGGFVLLTYPFLYAECDFHDYQRWTIEGMNHALAQRGLVAVLVRRRGGPLFAAACALTWAMQHAIPGQRKSWRAERTVWSIVRSATVALLTVPTNVIAWIALGLDTVLPTQGAYMGGAVLARKQLNGASEAGA